MELKEAKLCGECKGGRGGYGNYTNSDHHIEFGAGDWENCHECEGTGEEKDEDIIVERIIENLTKEQEDTLEEWFMENDDIGAMSSKDNIEDHFEHWLGTLVLSDLESILFSKKYNVYLIGALNLKGIAIKGCDLSEEDMNALIAKGGYDLAAYSLVGYEVGSPKDLELANDLKEY